MSTTHLSRSPRFIRKGDVIVAGVTRKVVNHVVATDGGMLITTTYQGRTGRMVYSDSVRFDIERPAA